MLLHVTLLVLHSKKPSNLLVNMAEYLAAKEKDRKTDIETELKENDSWTFVYLVGRNMTPA